MKKIITTLLVFIINLVIWFIIYRFFKFIYNKSIPKDIREKISESVFEEDEFRLYRESELEKKIKSEINLELKNQDRVLEKELELKIKDAIDFSKNTIYAIFDSIHEKNTDNLTNISKKIYFKIKNKIDELNRLNQTEFFEEVKIFQNTPVSYTKHKGYFIIDFRIKLFYCNYVLENEKFVSGDKKQYLFKFYKMSIAYIYDLENLDEKIKQPILEDFKSENNLHETQNYEDNNFELVKNIFIAVDFFKNES